MVYDNDNLLYKKYYNGISMQIQGQDIENLGVVSQGVNAGRQEKFRHLDYANSSAVNKNRDTLTKHQESQNTRTITQPVHSESRSNKSMENDPVKDHTDINDSN